MVCFGFEPAGTGLWAPTKPLSYGVRPILKLFLFAPWCGSNGHRARLLFWWFEFDSCWSLQMLFKNDPLPASFSFLFNTVDSKQCSIWNLPMTGFEPRTFESGRSTNWASTTAQVFSCYSKNLFENKCKRDRWWPITNNLTFSQKIFWFIHFQNHIFCRPGVERVTMDWTVDQMFNDGLEPFNGTRDDPPASDDSSDQGPIL